MTEVACRANLPAPSGIVEVETETAPTAMVCSLRMLIKPPKLQTMGRGCARASEWPVRRRFRWLCAMREFCYAAALEAGGEGSI